MEIPLTAGKTLKFYEATSRPVIKNETISMFHSDFHLIATDGTRVTALRSTDACWRDFSNNHVCPRLTEMTTNENKCLISAFVHKRMSSSTCSDDIHSASITHTTVIRLAPNCIVIAAKSPTLITVNSLDGDSSAKLIEYSSKLTARRPCTILVNEAAHFLSTHHESSASIHLHVHLDYVPVPIINNTVDSFPTMIDYPDGLD